MPWIDQSNRDCSFPFSPISELPSYTSTMADRHVTCPLVLLNFNYNWLLVYNLRLIYVYNRIYDLYKKIPLLCTTNYTHTRKKVHIENIKPVKL